MKYMKGKRHVIGRAEKDKPRAYFVTIYVYLADIEV
jgi:hypothetical protein